MKKFVKTKFESLDGKLIVAHTAEDDSLQLRSDKIGMTIKGEMTFESQEELQEFFHLMGASWAEHLKMKQAVLKSLSQKSLSGH